MLLIKLRQAGRFVFMVLAMLSILTGVLGIVILEVNPKERGVSWGGLIWFIAVGVAVLLYQHITPEPKFGRQLAEVRLPFLAKKEHGTWWLLDKGAEKAVISVRHWRKGGVKGTSLGYVFPLEDAPVTADIRESLANSEQRAQYVKDGFLVKLADGPYGRSG